MKKLMLTTFIIATMLVQSASAEENNYSTLRIFIQNIQTEHPAFRRFAATNKKVDAEAKAMGAYRYNPEISFDGENKNGADDIRAYSIAQTIDITGKNFAQKRVGQNLALAQKAEITQQRANYIASIIKALADYEVASNVLKLVKEQAEIMVNFAQIANKRNEVGDIGSTELALANLAAAESQSRMADSTASLETAKAELSVLCGCNPELAPKLKATPPTLVFTEDWETLATSLPTYLASTAANEAAQANVSLKKRERIPDPTFSLGTGVEGGTDLVTFGISIPIPVFNSGSYEVEAAAAESLESKAQVQETKAKILAALKRQARVYAGHQQALQFWSSLAKPNLSTYTQNLEKQWNAGELSASNYLLQVKQGIETAITGAFIKANAWGAWANWMALTGEIENWVATPNIKENK